MNDGESPDTVKSQLMKHKEQMNRIHDLTVVALLLAPFAALHAVADAENPKAWPDGVRRVGPSELRIERDYIGEPGLARPVPQGLVDVNPPWLHVQVPLPEGKKAVRAHQQWHRRFCFKLVPRPATEEGRD